MMDKRNEYRAVSRMTTHGEMWKVQVRHWWLPIWMTVTGYAHNVAAAREYAMNHASKGRHVRRVVTFGRFPASSR